MRRSDYKEHLAEWYGKDYVETDYFPRAIEYYRKHFKVRKFIRLQNIEKHQFSRKGENGAVRSYFGIIVDV